ncbi:hypothetical protein BUALT_BualtUnG0014500 [Buddleja alternifolia]|uniref:Inositol polyphosphate-related phosphatase domain-containing protein n=1 Tax=Buddleja alternifolia TaxID=168488 RepID=A0AAV6W7J4_9LAMI|nr:hypothetical protein BUALT_BualtUnG0014500 [Buddleja alternifolia]
MNGQVCHEDIEKLVGNERKYDLLVIGLQEVPRTNVLELLENALVESHVLLGKATMQSLQLYMFGFKNSKLYIKDLKVDKQGIGGCGGLIGRKKGAVAIRISYKDIHMVFISCHLSAHARNVEERNSECRHISHSLFSKAGTLTPNQLKSLYGWEISTIDFEELIRFLLESSFKKTFMKHTTICCNLGVERFGWNFMMVMLGPSKVVCASGVSGRGRMQLASKDQLLQEAERGQVFNGYCEGTLAFKPTYKYNIGTSDYDTSYKVRVPAWTDRILYKIEDNDITATLHLYESIDGIYGSDHKPVKAHLCLKSNKLIVQGDRECCLRSELP